MFSPWVTPVILPSRRRADSWFDTRSVDRAPSVRISSTHMYWIYYCQCDRQGLQAFVSYYLRQTPYSSTAPPYMQLCFGGAVSIQSGGLRYSNTCAVSRLVAGGKITCAAPQRRRHLLARSISISRITSQ